MHITRLDLFDFRNYAVQSVSPGTGLNLVLGPNAQGKTNLLEALYALATTKSARTSRDADLIRFGAPAARVVASVARQGDIETVLELAIGAPGAPGVGERKVVRVNQSKQARVTDLLGHLNAVLFAATDLDIVRGEPDERRRFLNYEIAQISPRYALALAAYRRALEQRNRLLKDIRYGHSSAASLDAWSGPLIEHGSRMLERRKSYLERLAVHAAELHTDLTEGRETLAIVYEPSFALGDAVSVDEIAGRFQTRLAEVRRDEIARGTTLAGPQRDDLVFRIGADEKSMIDARAFGSQGQQRTVALSLRLAERALIEETLGETPITLLDDVLSDLDALRRARLLARTLSGGQTFLTATDLDALPADVRESSIDDARVFTVANGHVTERIGG